MSRAVVVRSLAECEAKIETFVGAWYEAGLALAEIDRGLLYIGAGYDSFAEYLRGRWKWTSGRAYQQIRAANVAQVCTRVHNVPRDEKQARVLVRLPDEEILEVARRVDFNDPKTTAGVVREAARQVHHIKAGRAAVPAPAFDKPTFRVFYADPPWQYRQTGLTEYRPGVEGGMVEDQYPTMELGELKALPVSRMALPDSVLFLWATSPMLEDALELMRAWEFGYKASLVWDKHHPFRGSYAHISHELLLIGVRGSCPADQVHTKGSVFSFKRTKHSRKPDEFRVLIDSMYTFGNRIELFRRGDTPEGWHVWGNEASDG